MKQLSELSNIMLVKDFHHLKTKVWPEYLGLSKFDEVKRHLDEVLNCRTQVEYDRHRLNHPFLHSETSIRILNFSGNILIILNQLLDTRCWR